MIPVNLYYMTLLKEIRACTLCSDVLPLPPRPILQFGRSSSLLIVGQAPGFAAHESGRPWNDASGERLRQWIEITHDHFYDPARVAIVPMGFCYPGRGKNGDLPPRPECSIRWMDTILSELKNIQMTVIIGSYAASYFCGKDDLSTHIMEHAFNLSSMIVLPHPSPRNNIWLAKNPWFVRDCLPAIRKKFWRKVSHT